MKKSLFIPVFTVALFLLSVFPAGAKTLPPGFDFQGHRGARGLYPENTIPGFMYAAELGVTTLELDLQLTKDEIPVISHNPRLESYLTKYNGKWINKGSEPVIAKMTLRELQKYTVGETDPDSDYYKQRCPNQTVVPGTKVPTLEELFINVNRNNFNHVRFNIELKVYPDGPDAQCSADLETFVKAVMKVIKQYRMESRTTIQCFDWRVLLEFRRLYKDEVLLAALTCEQPDELCRQVGVPGCSPWMAGLDIDDFDGNYVKAAKAVYADIISPYYKELDEKIIKEAHALGIKVIPWTVNDREDMERLIDWGVDGIITDRPDILKEIILERKINI